MAAPSSPPCAPSSLYFSFPLFFVHVLKEDREAAAVSSRPKSSPESPSFLPSPQLLSPSPPLPLTTSPSAEETVVSLSPSPSLPINTSRSLPRSDSRFKSLQMQRKEESRLPLSLSLWPACWPGQGPTRPRPAGRRSFQDAVSRHVIDASQPDFKLWPPSCCLSHWPSRRPQV